MQPRPFYFDIQIRFPPDLLHRKLQLLMLQVFLIYANFSRLFLSAILYDLSAILQAERLAFRLYEALKIRSTGSFSLLAILQYSKYCRFAIVSMKHVPSMNSKSIQPFDYTNFSGYGIESFSYIFDLW